MNVKRWVKSLPYSQKLAPYIFISPFIKIGEDYFSLVIFHIFLA